MPRYKVVCSCKTEFWVKRSAKLDASQTDTLKRRSLCPECTRILRERCQIVKTGEFRLVDFDRPEYDKLIQRLIENKPFGFGRQLTRDYFLDMTREDAKTVAEGITTRYRGFSPTYETFRRKYRILVAKAAWAASGLGEMAL